MTDEFGNINRNGLMLVSILLLISNLILIFKIFA